MKMKRVFLTIVAMVMVCAGVQAQDVIVKNDLESLKVYNLEISDNFVFFQLSSDEGATIQKLPVKDIMIIRKADGTKIDPSAAKTISTTTIPTETKETRSRILLPQEPREAVTGQLCSDIKKKKDGNEFKALTSENDILKYKILSEDEHTLKVIGISKVIDISINQTPKGCVIPEYVDVNGSLFTVTEIGEGAFSNGRMESCQFPNTLKRIGKRAFYRSCLKTIILPEGLEYIDEQAFYLTGHLFEESYFKKYDVEVISIPTTVKEIGKDAFREMGDNHSPRGYFQGRIDCLPKWINPDNCSIYGIDNRSVEDYEARLK